MSRPVAQISGNDSFDKFNRAYLASVSDQVLIVLWAGKFGIPGLPLMGKQLKTTAEDLAAEGEKVTQADMFGLEPAAWMLALNSGGYKSFSYAGEKPEDWETMRPGDHDPTGRVPDYNGDKHTGVVAGLDILFPPYTGPSWQATLVVGPRANSDGDYNVINGGEIKDGQPRPVGDIIVENGVRYEFKGVILGVPYWHILGK